MPDGSAVSADFEPVLPDRKLYLAWAKRLLSNVESDFSSLSDVPAAILKKHASLFELTRRVGENQKGECEFRSILVHIPKTRTR
jgi:hypothetical protein